MMMGQWWVFYMQVLVVYRWRMGDVKSLFGGWEEEAKYSKIDESTTLAWILHSGFQIRFEAPTNLFFTIIDD